MLAGPARRHYNPDIAGVLGLLAELGSRPGLTHVAVGMPDFRLELRQARTEAIHGR
jgi:oxaloacetate decarboxylase alpha subunit